MVTFLFDPSDERVSGMELLPVDLGAVEWLIDHDRRHRGDGSSFSGRAPAVFEVYLRILHPAQLVVGGVPRDVSWREVAGATGKPLLASCKFEDFDDVYEVPGFGRLVSPAGMTGDLGDVQCNQLVDVLGVGNTEPDGCIVGFASHRASFVPSSPALKAVDFKGGTYLFAASSFAQVCDFGMSPSFWWPKDRSWILVTPSDSTSSLMGCGAETAAAVLSVGVEALVIGPDDPVPL